MASYYVASSGHGGSDSNPGTIGSPTGVPHALATLASDQSFDFQIAWGTAATGNIFQVTGFSLRLN